MRHSLTREHERFTPPKLIVQPLESLRRPFFLHQLQRKQAVHGEYNRYLAFPPATDSKLLLDYMMSLDAQDPILDGEEKRGDNSHQSMTINAEIGEANSPPRQEVEYVTGWRFVAVGIAIVLSMFLVRHHLKRPWKLLSQQADTCLGFLRSGETFTPAESSLGPRLRPRTDKQYNGRLSSLQQFPASRTSSTA